MPALEYKTVEIEFTKLCLRSVDYRALPITCPRHKSMIIITSPELSVTFRKAETICCWCSVAYEEAREVWVIVKDVMRVAVGLEATGQPKAVTVAAYSTSEPLERDAWGLSDHQVFRCRRTAIVIGQFEHGLHSA